MKAERFKSFTIEHWAKDRRFYIVGYYGVIGRQCVGEARTMEDAEALVVKLNKIHQIKKEASGE